MFPLLFLLLLNSIWKHEGRERIPALEKGNGNREQTNLKLNRQEPQLRVGFAIHVGLVPGSSILFPRSTEIQQQFLRKQFQRLVLWKVLETVCEHICMYTHSHTYTQRGLKLRSPTSQRRIYFARFQVLCIRGLLSRFSHF